MAPQLRPNSALIVVDMQNDFISGSLAVPGAHEIIKPVNDLIMLFYSQQLPLVFTADGHVQQHPSFIPQGGKWPPHCVLGTAGADIHYGIFIPMDSTLIRKGLISEAYSGFEGTELDIRLKAQRVESVYICGLAFDYCVKATAIDARKLGYKTTVVNDATKYVDVKTATQAWSEMSTWKVELINDI